MMIANAKRMRQSAASAVLRSSCPCCRDPGTGPVRVPQRGTGASPGTDRRSDRQLLGRVRPARRAGPDRRRVRDAAGPVRDQASPGRSPRRCQAERAGCSSEYCQVRKRITVERLDHFDERKGEWKEVLIEDRHAGPAETAAARIDIADWFASLPRHKRRIAQTLATGETTKRTASKFRVTPGRISQMRRELQAAWAEFQGEPAAT